jgi:hypothetical protein
MIAYGSVVIACGVFAKCTTAYGSVFNGCGVASKCKTA